MRHACVTAYSGAYGMSPCAAIMLHVPAKQCQDMSTAWADLPGLVI